MAHKVGTCQSRMHWDRSRSDMGTCHGSRGCPGEGEGGGTQIPQKVREASVVDYIYIYIYIYLLRGGGVTAVLKPCKVSISTVQSLQLLPGPYKY